MTKQGLDSSVETLDAVERRVERPDTFSRSCELSGLKFFSYSITSHDLDLNLTLAGLLRIAWHRHKRHGIFSDEVFHLIRHDRDRFFVDEL